MRITTVCFKHEPFLEILSWSERHWLSVRLRPKWTNLSKDYWTHKWSVQRLWGPEYCRGDDDQVLHAGFLINQNFNVLHFPFRKVLVVGDFPMHFFVLQTKDKIPRPQSVRFPNYTTSTTGHFRCICPEDIEDLCHDMTQPLWSNCVKEEAPWLWGDGGMKILLPRCKVPWRGLKSVTVNFPSGKPKHWKILFPSGKPGITSFQCGNHNKWTLEIEKFWSVRWLDIS